MLESYHSRSKSDKILKQTGKEGSMKNPKHFTPLYDRILVKRQEPEEKAGRIIIPDTAKEKPMEGTVISVGAGQRSEQGQTLPMAVKPGDRVLFGKWSGSEVKFDGEEFIIMKESDIMGILG
jgi:chaperonin GroES